MDRDDQILEYVQNRLAPADRAQFEKMMAQDSALAAEVDLMRSVREELAAAPPHENAQAVWDKLSTAMEPAPIPANANRQPWIKLAQYAAVAALAIAVWQFTVVPRLDGTADGFEMATGQTAGFVLQVKFIESAPMGEITALLLSLDASITEGPSALGLVQVSFADDASRQEALTRFNTRSDLVETALVP